MDHPVIGNVGGKHIEVGDGSVVQKQVVAFYFELVARDNQLLTDVDDGVGNEGVKIDVDEFCDPILKGTLKSRNQRKTDGDRTEHNQHITPNFLDKEDKVGASVGDDLKKSAIYSLGIGAILIVIYITMRLNLVLLLEEFYHYYMI